VTAIAGRIVSGWNRFWFEPTETSSLALFRIAFGLITVVWTATLIPNVSAFYGPNGILPSVPDRDPGEWGLLAFSTNPVLTAVVVAGTLVAAVAVTVGVFTRVASIALWIGVVSLIQRNAYITNSGDGVLRDMAFLLMLTPAGAALSVDRLRVAPRRFWEFPARAPWGLRLIQIQISVGYLSAALHKMSTDLWWDGSAVSYALRMDDIHRLHFADFVSESVALTGALTYGTMFVELALAVLIWNRRLRPWVLVLGIGLHLGIDSSIMVGYFSYLMLAGYLAFVPPETMSRVVIAMRDWVRRLSLALMRRRSGESNSEGGVDLIGQRDAAGIGVALGGVEVVHDVGVADAVLQVDEAEAPARSAVSEGAGVRAVDAALVEHEAQTPAVVGDTRTEDDVGVEAAL
jgi:hypothetical protein